MGGPSLCQWISGPASICDLAGSIDLIKGWVMPVESAFFSKHAKPTRQRQSPFSRLFPAASLATSSVDYWKVPHCSFFRRMASLCRKSLASAAAAFARARFWAKCPWTRAASCLEKQWRSRSTSATRHQRTWRRRQYISSRWGKSHSAPPHRLSHPSWAGVRIRLNNNARGAHNKSWNKMFVQTIAGCHSEISFCAMEASFGVEFSTFFTPAWFDSFKTFSRFYLL